jgi:hypothetical protein
MRAKIAQADIAKARVQRVDVGEVRIGAVHVDRLTIGNVHVQSSTGVAQMRNVVVALKLAFGLDWRVGLKISMPDGIPDVDFSDSGTLDLGTLRLGVGLGDLTLPGLASLAFDIPSLAVNDLNAVIGSLKNLNLGAAMAERIRAQGIAAPAGGFTVAGLGIAGARVDGVSVPDAAIASTTIGRVSGGTLPLAGLTIPGVELPDVLLPAVSSRNVDAASNPVVSKMPTVDVGLLAATLKVTTTATFHVDELRIDNVRASTSIGEITMQNVVLPYEILDVTLSQIGIETIEVPQLEVS